ncbi:MAG: hypothetical protein QOI99_1318, partial [Actinomycetota bacterium]|nr:hypothetical protein [Actinomycetota bacterium]
MWRTTPPPAPDRPRPPPDGRRVVGILTQPRAALRSLFPSDLEPGQAGDPGVVGPDGPVWRIAREKAILAGGPGALLL